MVNSFTVLGLTLYPYSLLMVFGTIVALALFAYLSCKRHRKERDENLFAIEMLIIAVAAALPAAMVLDSLFKIEEKGKFELEGATFYGGLLCALILFPVLLSFNRKRAVSIYDRMCDFATCIPAGHFFGRIGCFLGGCCFGVPTDSIFGVVFPEGSAPYQAYGGVAVHPTQLYEAAVLLVIFVILILFGKKHALPLYMMLYGLGRYVVECFRGDDRGSVGVIPLSPAQFISLLLILAGGAILVAVTILQARGDKTIKRSPTEQQKNDSLNS